MWKSFQETLRTHCSYKESEEVLVECARETFVALDNWLFGGGDQGWLNQNL
jgi:heme oxygenase